MLEVSTTIILNTLKKETKPLNKLLEEVSASQSPPPHHQLGYEKINGRHTFTAAGLCPDITAGLAKSLHHRFGYNIELFYIYLVHESFRLPHFLLSLQTPDLSLLVDGSFGQISGSHNKIITLDSKYLEKFFRPQTILRGDLSDKIFRRKGWSEQGNLLIGSYHEIGDISAIIYFRGQYISIADIIVKELS
jgi:hypothetical protein